MKRGAARIALLLAWAGAAVSTTARAAGPPGPAEVYRDDVIAIGAAIGGASDEPVFFGDVLTLTVSVEFDPAAMTVRGPDEDLFLATFPASGAVLLSSWTAGPETVTESGWEHREATYRFQVVGCPEDQPTCPGPRNFLLPQLTLACRYLGDSDGAGRDCSVRFHPRPASIMVSTGLAKDEEGQLLPFETYFPDGGYPEPLQVTGHSAPGWALAGAAFIAFTGGLLMWPFRSKGPGDAAAEIPRWRRVLQELPVDGSGDDTRYVDSLRRCLVWYCNDELQVDPFLWLDLAELAEGDEVDEAHGELRGLFAELLHKPAGQNRELRARLAQLIAGSGNA